MSEIIFLSVEQVCSIQEDTLPGASSSNIGLIEGAVNRIINQYHYNGISDVFELSAWLLPKPMLFQTLTKEQPFNPRLYFYN